LTTDSDKRRSYLPDLNDLGELNLAYESGGVEECKRLLERKRDEWKTVPLNVAVIGNSGVGKSAFINAIRRLTADDEESADVGVKECTAEIESYPHPNNPLLKFWDLPGVGTDKFPGKTYLAKIKVDRYDFFLLITATRFTEYDTWLGKEFRKRNKKYFFVRTKIGQDVSNNKRAHPRTHNEEAVMRVIRESTEERLRTNGCEDASVFLIDSYRPKKFDFDRLEKRLVEEFQKLKRCVLILSLQTMSEEMIQRKVAELRSRMWQVAALSGAVTAALPGLTGVYDAAVVAEQTQFYYTQLGLDEISLKRYARVMSADYRQLRSHVDRCLGYEVSSVEAVKKLIGSLHATPLFEAAAAEINKCIPEIGRYMVAPLSFAGTYYALKLILEKMERVALEVIHFAAENTEQSDSDND